MERLCLSLIMVDDGGEKLTGWAGCLKMNELLQRV